MTASIYEQQDAAVAAQVDCPRCARRTYFANRDLIAFKTRHTNELQARCVGCGYVMYDCPCPEARPL